MHEGWIYFFAAIAAISAIYTIVEKIFGGGNKLAAKFGKLEQDTSDKIHALRNEFVTLSTENNTNTRVGIEAIVANMHTMQMGFAEFRAFMAENYVKRDSFYNTMREFKADFKETMSEFKNEIRSDLKEVKEEVNGVSMSVEAGRRERG